jgi:polyhydroxyalkanoate synthesis regulator phasin
MLELVEKTLLAGIGALSLTQKKTEELIAEVQKQFNLSEEKGKELFSKLEEAARENQRKLEELARQEVLNSCERMGLVTAEDLEILRRKIDILEEQIRALQEEKEAQHTPPMDL